MVILDALKDAANVLREADKIPQYQAVLDAYSQIAELQATSYSQQLKIQELTGVEESGTEDRFNRHRMILAGRKYRADPFAETRDEARKAGHPPFSQSHESPIPSQSPFSWWILPRWRRPNQILPSLVLPAYRPLLSPHVYCARPAKKSGRH